MIRHSFTAFSALAALLFCGVARADATTEARDAYDEGARAYDAKDYPNAAKSFAVADERVPSGRALELAMASALLANDAALGMDLVVRAERRSVDGSLAALAAKLKKRFADAVGTVTLVCPSGVSCQGDLEGRALVAGVPRHAVPGSHVVAITLDGATTPTTITVERGHDFVATLFRVAGAPARPSPPSPEAPNPPIDRGLSPVYFGVAAGLSAVGLGTAIGLTFVTKNLHDDFRATPSRASSDAGSEAQTATRIVWGVTGALAASSVVLFVLTDFGKREEAKVAVGIGPGSVSLAGRF